MKKIVFRVNSAFKVKGLRTGKVYAEGLANTVWTLRSSAEHVYQIISSSGMKMNDFYYPVQFQPEDPNAAFQILQTEDRKGVLSDYKNQFYRGTLLAHADGKGLYMVNAVFVEDYLAGVLPAEMPAEWPMEALKAQAVIARTYAVSQVRDTHPHAARGFDLCDTQHCQVYRGISAEHPRATQAVLQTRGQLLYAQGRLVNSYYSSNCGGCTRAAKGMRGWGEASYLQSKLDLSSPIARVELTPWTLQLWIKSSPASNCNLPELVSSSQFRWLRKIPADALERKINRNYRVGKIKRIIPLERDNSGRVKEVLVEGTRGRAVLDGENIIRPNLGISPLRSTLWVMAAETDASGFAKEFWIYGGGWGHGVGLCQTGACGLALREKWNYEQILKFYYEGSSIISF